MGRFISIVHYVYMQLSVKLCLLGFVSQPTRHARTHSRFHMKSLYIADWERHASAFAAAPRALEYFLHHYRPKARM